MGPDARLWRRVGLAIVVVCAFGGVGVAGAPAATTTPDPQPLWQAYPLDDTPKADASTTSPAPSAQNAPASRPVTNSPALAPQGAASGPSWIVLLAAAIGGAAFVALVLALYDRLIARPRARARAEADAVAPELPRELFRPPTPILPAERPSQPAALRPGTRTPNGQPEPRLQLRPSIIVIPSAKPPVDEPAAPTEREAGRAAAASRSNGPVCQVKWSRRAARFHAVTIDEDGTERRIARSPRFEWDELSPPEDASREAQAALRALAKELREKGWRPLRAKGVDFDERRWYARRFRWPTEAEQQGTGGNAPPRERVGGREGARGSTR
jgi:hypothetical protein